jgi:hypothetical protein
MPPVLPVAARPVPFPPEPLVCELPPVAPVEVPLVFDPLVGREVDWLPLTPPGPPPLQPTATEQQSTIPRCAIKRPLTRFLPILQAVICAGL